MSLEKEDPVIESDLVPAKLREEAVEFAPEEMLTCGGCGRKSPPNRVDCVYCGVPIAEEELASKSVLPVLRGPEEDAEGVTLVLEPEASPSPEIVAAISSVCKINADEANAILSASTLVPMVCTEEGRALDVATGRLAELGLTVHVVRDSELELRKPQHRLRGGVREPNLITLILFNNDEIVTLTPEDIQLIVTGRLIEQTTESVVQKKKRDGKVTDSSEETADEFVVDIYARGKKQGYRIIPSGFDFSFLGDRKGLLVSENLKMTLQEIRDFAPEAEFVESYDDQRKRLDGVWPVDVREQSKGMKRLGFGRFERNRVSTSSNEEQFLRFSRILWHLKRAKQS